MTQLIANVALQTDSFETWLVKTNLASDHVSKQANTTGVPYVKTINLHSTSSANTLKLSVHGNAVFTNVVSISSANSLWIKSGGVNGLFSNGLALKMRDTDTGEVEWGNAVVVFSDVTGFLANGDFAAVQAPTTGAWTFSANLTATGANTNFIGNHTFFSANVVISGTSTFNKNATFNKNIIASGNADFTGSNTNITGTTYANTLNLAGNFTGQGTHVAKQGAPISTVDANTYTLVIGDNGKYIRMANTGGVTVTIPTNASY